MDYTVFDVETANNQRDSICSIGIIRYENNQVIYEKEILINPEVEFNYFNTRINGITSEDVADAPTFPEVWPEIKQYFDNTILVAHNARSMDLCALYRTLDRYDLPTVNNDYICTMELAKEIFKKDDSVQSYRLDVLSNLYNIDLLHHHDSLDDTRACFEILQKFEELYPKAIKVKHYNYGNPKCDSCTGSGNQSYVQYSEKTKEMQKLQTIVLDIIKDNVVTDQEIEDLQTWLNTHETLKGFYPFDKIFELVEYIMLDGRLDPEEEHELLKLLDAFINPQTEKTGIDFNGKIVCLSGDFNYGTKKQVEELLSDRGAVVVGSVTMKTDILVLGEAGSAAWKYGNYGSKYEKARQLKEKGKDVIIVKEKDVV